MSRNTALIEVLARSENIGFVRVAVASFASQLDFTLGELEEIKVAVSEGVSNAIIHAYEGEEEGLITIKLSIEDSILRIEILDYGQGMEDLEGVFEPSFTTAGRMGLGLVFIDSFMDMVKIVSPPEGGTSLLMEKYSEKVKEHTCEGD